MPRAAVVELDDCLSKPVNLLSVGKYSSRGRDSIRVVQEEVDVRELFPNIFPVLVPLVLCLQWPKPPFFPDPHPLPCLLQAM